MTEPLVDLARLEECRKFVEGSRFGPNAHNGGYACDSCAGGAYANPTPETWKPWPAHAPDCEVGMVADLLATVTRLAEAVEALNISCAALNASCEIAQEENARLRLKNEQYQAMLDDKWTGVVTLVNDQTNEVARLRAALEPFASGVEWGTLKAWLVAGAEVCATREDGVKAAALLTSWQVAADAALASHPTPPGEER